ncbi:MAG: hypothetical protein JNL83_04790 [Myxococcales bacterium]|nr:hypothetical protein [Myxococcales bacterium]
MSTARAALLLVLVGCGSSKQDAAPAGASCLPATVADTGAGLVAVDGAKVTACWGGICLHLDREGKVIGPAQMPATAPPQVQQDQYIGKTVARRDPGGQWSLEDPATGAKVPVGAPGMRLEVYPPGVVITYQGKKLHLADAKARKETGDFTLGSPIAGIVPLYDRLLIVLEKPAGTAQLDPASATLYQGPELPRCR